MFITLHRAANRPIYINPDHISKIEATGPFQKAQNPEWKTVLSIDGQTMAVTETPEEIMQMVIWPYALYGHLKETPVDVLHGMEVRSGVVVHIDDINDGSRIYKAAEDMPKDMRRLHRKETAGQLRRTPDKDLTGGGRTYEEDGK